MKKAIALMSDFGLTDPYVGVLKAVILGIAPEARVVDLTHGIEAQNVIHGASVLETSYTYFPTGTIFVCVVDPGVGTHRKIICAQSSRYHFIGPDNGLLSGTLQKERGVTIRSLENKKFFLKTETSRTFHGRDVMAPTAAWLWKSKNKNTFTQVGPKLSSLHDLKIPPIKKIKGGLEGTILYFDHFGNAITNIDRENANQAFWKKSEVSLSNHSLGRLASTYGSGTSTLKALFNSFSKLELAIPCGNAKEEAKLSVGDSVKVTALHED